MHAVFIAYGKRSEVELLFRDMEAQKFYMPMHKEGKEIKILIQGGLRYLPLGAYEYVFPKEYLNIVLHTLDFDQDRYSLGKTRMALLRALFKCQKAPKYEKKEYYPWIKDHVCIIPIGIREDAEGYIEGPGLYEGYSHECI